jgi:hypothetical protein
LALASERRRIVTFFIATQEARAESHHLATVHRLPARAFKRERRRRTLATFTKDAVGQGVIWLSLAMALLVASVLLRRDGAYALGTGIFGAAIVALSGFMLLSMRAVKRDKVIEYWSDRRALRLELRWEKARGELLTKTLLRVHDLDQHCGGDVRGVLAELVEDLYAVLAAGHDETAVTLALETQGRYWVLHNATGVASRWRGLAPGKSCSTHGGSFEEKLASYASYHQAFSVPTASGHLRIGVLSDGPFSVEDKALFMQVPVCFSLVAARWRQSARPTMEPLYAIESTDAQAL